ncbi:ribosome hibernation-promoting factor, HPF/YfiA family [candidate division KSB1 bacterium]
MKLKVTGRHMEVSDQLQEYIENKVTKLSRIYPALIETGVVVERDRFQYVTEVSVHAKPFDLFGRGRNENVNQSVLASLKKVERQLVKHKERMQEHKGKGPQTALPEESV